MPEIVRSNKYRLREMISISFPIILEQVSITLMGMVSSILVSSGVGAQALSAVSMIDSISNIIISLFSALTTGSTIVVAQYVGRRDIQKATEASGQALISAVVFSLFIFLNFLIFRNIILNSLFSQAEPLVIQSAEKFFFVVNFSFPVLAVAQTCFGVLRGSGNTGTPMKISILMNIINVLAGYVLIFGISIPFTSIHLKGLGVVGAALALLISRSVGMLVSLVYLARFSGIIKLNKLCFFKPNLSLLKIILGLGVPTSVEGSLFNVGKLITQTYIVSMGTAAIAANSIGSAVFGFINVPGNAFATGVMILVGQRIGRGEADDVKKTIFFAIKLGMAMMAVMCIICFPLNNLIITIYRAEPASAEILKQVLGSAYIASPIFWAMSFLLPAGLRATGDVRYTMFVAIFSMWVFRIFVGYFFGIALGWGLLGVWIGMYTDWFVRGVLFYFRLIGDKWKTKSVIT